MSLRRRCHGAATGTEAIRFLIVWMAGRINSRQLEVDPEVRPVPEPELLLDNLHRICGDLGRVDVDVARMGADLPQES